MLLFKLECKRLFSGWINKLVLLLFAVSGLFAIYQGAQGYKSVRIDQYKSKIVFDKEREHIQKRDTLPEAGAIAYRAQAPTEWKLSPWAALFVGQSQTSLAAKKITAEALQGQIYNREIINPTQLRTGGLDLGFVIVYLLPLVIGILSVTLISDEQHAGRWRLLNALPKSAFNMLFKQFTLRFGVIWLIATSLLLGAALLLKLPFDSQFFIISLAITVYMLFWFALAVLIMSLGKSSVVNSLGFLSAWVIFAILIPGAVHLYLPSQFQTNAPLEASLKQRMVLNDGWDQNKQAALDKFLQNEQAWIETEPLGAAFDWKWYFAQHHLSDLAVKKEWQAYLDNSALRQQRLQQLSLLSPCLFLQLKLNQVAQTNSEHYLYYLAQLEEYHATIRHFFYDFLFFNKEMSNDDLDSFTAFQAKNTTSNAKPYWLLFGTLFVLGFALSSAFKLRKLQP